MILSPLGNNLASWWCSRHKNYKDSVRHRKQSLAGVISYLSSKVKGVRRCISLPDLSRISSLFNPDEDPSEKKMFYKLNSPRSFRFRTSNEVLFQHSSKEPILEESEAELMHLSTETTPLETISNSKSTSRKSTVSPPLEGKELTKSPDANGYLHKNTIVEDEVQKEKSGTGPSSSCSSGCSSNALVVTLHSGEVTRQKRYQTAKSVPKPPTYNCENSIPSPSPPKHQNRDSGYDDSASEENSVVSPGCDAHHHLPWRIPEETALSCPIAK